MTEKKYMTYDEMIALLQFRNVCINSPEEKRRSKMILKHEGYYNVINGYKAPFLVSDSSETYRLGTTVGEILRYMTLIAQSEKYS